MIFPNPHLSYSQKREYYESLKHPSVPTAWFAGDLMHYLFVADFAIGKKVLDVGCGLGYGSYHLCLEGADEVIGIDMSIKSLSEAKERFSHPNLEFLPIDATAMSFPDETFDLVVSFEMLEHLPASSTHPYMREIVRVLKADGKFAISTPNRDVYSLGSKKSKTPGHINELSAQEFVPLMQQYFRECDFFYQHKYDRSELELMKEQEIRIQNNAKLSWRRFVPVPIKQAIKRVIKHGSISPEDADLVQQMQLGEIRPVDEMADIELSSIQMAVCKSLVALSDQDHA